MSARNLWSLLGVSYSRELISKRLKQGQLLFLPPSLSPKVWQLQSPTVKSSKKFLSLTALLAGSQFLLQLRFLAFWPSSARRLI